MRLWNIFGRQPPPDEESKASRTGGAIAAWTVGRPVWSERKYPAFAKEGYITNAVAHRCTRLIASGASSVPWILKNRAGVELDEHPILDLLRRPNPREGGARLMEALYSYTLLSGNGYLERVGPRGRPPMELWALRPDRMSIVPGLRSLPLAYEYEVHGQKVRWLVDQRTGDCEIMHFREFHPTDDWYGLARVEAAAYGIDRHNAASAHNMALLDNGARPSGALIFEPVSGGTSEPAQSAPEEVLMKAEDRLAERHGGPKNAGRPLVLGGKVKWEEMGTTPKDMDFNESKSDAARDICSAFGVPHVLVVEGESTYNNRAMAQLELWEDAILPLVDVMLDSLNTWLTPQYEEGLTLGVDLDEIPALEPRRESKRKNVKLFTSIF